MKPAPERPNVDEERAIKRTRLLERDPKFACLTCLVEFHKYADYCDHLDRIHAPYVPKTR